MCVLKFYVHNFVFYVMGYFFLCNIIHEQSVNSASIFVFVFSFTGWKSSHFRDFFVCGKSVLLLLLILLLLLEDRTHAGSLYNVCSSFLDGDLTLSLSER